MLAIPGPVALPGGGLALPAQLQALPSFSQLAPAAAAGAARATPGGVSPSPAAFGAASPAPAAATTTTVTLVDPTTGQQMLLQIPILSAPGLQQQQQQQQQQQVPGGRVEAPTGAVEPLTMLPMATAGGLNLSMLGPLLTAGIQQQPQQLVQQQPQQLVPAKRARTDAAGEPGAAAVVAAAEEEQQRPPGDRKAEDEEEEEEDGLEGECVRRVQWMRFGLACTAPCCKARPARPLVRRCRIRPRLLCGGALLAKRFRAHDPLLLQEAAMPVTCKTRASMAQPFAARLSRPWASPPNSTSPHNGLPVCTLVLPQHMAASCRGRSRTHSPAPCLRRHSSLCLPGDAARPSASRTCFERAGSPHPFLAFAAAALLPPLTALKGGPSLSIRQIPNYPPAYSSTS